MRSTNEEPIIEFVDQLLHDAILNQTSDIHIEPYQNNCRIRFRQHGILIEKTNIPLALATRIITRLKIMANVNIAEKRLPQDGRFYLAKEHNINVRVNTCPTLYGEKIVLRLLDIKKLNFNIQQLGFSATQEQLFLQKILNPQGLILVTGPTGCGKTSTLYAALHYLNQIEKNISSVEDPVEIELMGINQVNVNPKIGLDFATILRSFMRQDPDIIMIGEIRDAETAMIAMQAAQTGHLVLSTLHTNNACESLERLKILGIDEYHIHHAISLIIAQRLVRKLCEYCKQASTSNIPISYESVGCEHCQQGYNGRIGIFEMLEVNKFGDKSIMSLWDAGLIQVQNGVTSYNELIRVLGSKNA